jgi:beta-glucanase (GH16 family)
MPPWARDLVGKAMEAARAIGAAASAAFARLGAVLAPHVAALLGVAARVLHHVLGGLRRAADALRPPLARVAPAFVYLGRYLGQCLALLRDDTRAAHAATGRWVTRIGALTLSELWNAPQRLAHRGAIGAFAVLALVSSAPPPIAKVHEAVKPKGAWILVWNDEFNGTELNRRKWNVVVTPPDGESFGESYFADSPDTIRVGDGVLEMRAEPIGKNRYSGARLETQGLASWRYGRFEARIKVAQGAGTLTSFWMLHQDPTLEKWPNGGELDILEQLGRHPKLMEAVLHYKGVDKDRHHVMEWMDEPVGDAFHNFALEWTPEGFFWFLDGRLIHAYPPHTEHPFNREFFLILSLCIGGDWALSPNRQTKFPVVTQVDWVRVYAINPDYVRPAGDDRATVAQQGVEARPAPSGL